MKSLSRFLVITVLALVVAGCSSMETWFRPELVPEVYRDGVEFSSPVAGYWSIENTYIHNGTVIAGGVAVREGSVFHWSDSSGAVAVMSYNQKDNTIYLVFGRPFYGVGCTFGYPPPVPYLYPRCDEIGIRIDRGAGLIAFKNTPLRYYLSVTPLLGKNKINGGLEKVVVNGSFNFESF